MTREDSKKKLWATGNINTLSKVECDSLIDKIYDNFDEKTRYYEDMLDEQENEICENCKHLKKNECIQLNDWDCYNDSPANWTPPKDFGCNKFEQKDSK